MSTLYPIFYGTRLVTFDVLRNTFEPRMHPEAARRGFNFILHHEGRFGIGGGFRTIQPNRPGFAPAGKSFHQEQPFPSGLCYAAWDMIVVNPGAKHRSPTWGEVPAQGSALAELFGVHMNVGNEPWHMQPIELDGWGTWDAKGRPDLYFGRPIYEYAPPVEPPVEREIVVEFNSKVLSVGSTGPAVRFFQKILNEIAGQGLPLDGIFGESTKLAVINWQRVFGLVPDGIMGAKTQQSMIEVSLTV